MNSPLTASLFTSLSKPSSTLVLSAFYLKFKLINSCLLFLPLLSISEYFTVALYFHMYHCSSVFWRMHVCINYDLGAHYNYHLHQLS